ncbi:MAG TPA: hypothetical protein VFM34_10210 [Moraxellaceae bacterium]|nr:hypothetical protein [Moraxellaceae bacterium]
MNGGIRALMRWDECLRGVFDGVGVFLPGLCLRFLLSAGIFGGLPQFAVGAAAGGWAVAATMTGAALLLLGLATRYVAALFLLSGLSALWPVLVAGSRALALTGGGPMAAHEGVVAGLMVAQAAMLLALVGQGPGSLSLDHLVARRNGLV